MLPAFLADDAVRNEAGHSAPLDLAGNQGAMLLVTLGITRVIEQQSLDIAILGSADGETWPKEPLAAFPQKFYQGVHALLVDLSNHPEVRYLRASWKMSRWGRGEPKPSFGFYLYVEKAPVAAPVTAG